MTDDEKLTTALGIIKKMKSPTWWARAHYPNGLGDKQFWTEEEQSILKEATRG